MRETEARGWIEPNSSRALTRALRLAVVVLGIGIVMTAGAARAGDDDDDDKTFEEKLIGNIMAGIGGTNMDNRGIDYRERSPLVVPPRLDLPPPVAETGDPKIANWPKDPDEKRRKAAIAQRKKERPKAVNEDARLMSPDELRAARSGPSLPDPNQNQPGNTANAPALMSPQSLGFDGSLSHQFGGSKTETAEFKGEPTRDSLTQPPPGYQTPSSNFKYGAGADLYRPKQIDTVHGQYGD
jgi:hypothetical protein